MQTWQITLPLWQRAIWDGDKVLNTGTAPQWSAEIDPPAIGERVRVNFNEFGYGTVVGYFTEGRWLGVAVEVDVQPAWHLKQNGPEKVIHIFGPEFTLAE